MKVPACGNLPKQLCQLVSKKQVCDLYSASTTNRNNRNSSFIISEISIIRHFLCNVSHFFYFFVKRLSVILFKDISINTIFLRQILNTQYILFMAKHLGIIRLYGKHCTEIRKLVHPENGLGGFDNEHAMAFCSLVLQSIKSEKINTPACRTKLSSSLLFLPYINIFAQIRQQNSF